MALPPDIPKETVRAVGKATVSLKNGLKALAYVAKGLPLPGTKRKPTPRDVIRANEFLLKAIRELAPQHYVEIPKREVRSFQRAISRLDFLLDEEEGKRETG